jgi:prepilin-type N-terminal cleavage/methylation domain-containing protein
MRGSLKMAVSLKGTKGLSLVELLVALVVSSILMAAVYRTFISQQKTYVVQEQVVDMQQNARAAIGRMMREIRMAGFGNVASILTGGKLFGSKTLSNVITDGNPTGGLTVITVGASTTIAEDPSVLNQIKVTSLTDSQGNTLFDTGARKYIVVGGLEPREITNVDTGTKTLTLNSEVTQNPKQDTSVVALRAVSYQISGGTLTRDENLGGGAAPMADNISNLQLQYLDENGSVIADPVTNAANIRVVGVSVTARTSQSDPDYKDSGGYRTRTITSNIRVRNLGLN